jgi:transcriptional regulator with XRE-family HTH domain
MRLPPDQCDRIFAGEAPLKVWREFRQLAVSDVRRDTGIRVERLEKLERGLVKPTGAEILKLARVLDIAAHNLEPHGSHPPEVTTILRQPIASIVHCAASR